MNDCAKRRFLRPLNVPLNRLTEMHASPSQTCPACGRQSRFIHTHVNTLHNDSYFYLRCAACHRAVRLPEDCVAAIHTIDDYEFLWAAMDAVPSSKPDRHLHQYIRWYNAELSRRSLGLAVVLFFLLTGTGAPFFYVRRYWMGAACLGATAGLIALSVLLEMNILLIGAIAGSGLLGVGAALFAATCQMTDGHGRLLVPRVRELEIWFDRK